MLKKWYTKAINFFWRQIYGELTTVEKEAFYDSINSLFELINYLKLNNFKWASDGLNFQIDVDTFERPEQVLARKWANCGGFMRLYEDFIKYKFSKGFLMAFSYRQYELRGSYNWHYVMLIDDGVLLSNLEMIPISSNKTAAQMIKERWPEFQHISQIDEWRYKNVY